MASTIGLKRLALVAAVAIPVFAATAWIAAPSPTGRSLPPIAVLDSGVDATHPALAGKIVAARDFVDATGNTADASWHGTAVAGVIAGSDCPRCTIVSAKVLDAHDAGNDAEIARGVLWAVDAGARVVNLSMTGTGESPALRDAIRVATRRGVVVVAAAGNDGGAAKSFPAADPNVIGVAATAADGTVAAWSDHGAWVTIAAAGETTTALRGGGTTGFRGTSAAAPAVAAVVARCLGAAPHLSPAAIRAILVRTATPIAGVSFGRLDPTRALSACH